MSQRQLGEFQASPVSLGCMNLSHAYGTPPAEADAIKLLNRALDVGYTMLDTAALYGFGANETLLGKAVMYRRDEFVLTSKCGMFKNAEGKREINGHPDMLRKTCEDSLQRLGTEVIDLYYLHRWDKNVPIEESIGAMSELVKQGKIRSIGLSEVSADTLRKAHAVHPISAVQTEYSLWTRNAEIRVLDACKELGTAFIAFSPLARKFLTGKLTDVAQLADKDLRRNMPRFQPETYAKNLELLPPIESLAEQSHCSMAQLALAWVLAQGEHVIAIPGTTSIEHMEENFAAGAVQLDPEVIEAAGRAINQQTVHGPRYPAATQAEIDTEEF